MHAAGRHRYKVHQLFFLCVCVKISWSILWFLQQVNPDQKNSKHFVKTHLKNVLYVNQTEKVNKGSNAISLTGGCWLEKLDRYLITRWVRPWKREHFCGIVVAPIRKQSVAGRIICARIDKFYMGGKINCCDRCRFLLSQKNFFCN